MSAPANSSPQQWTPSSERRTVNFPRLHPGLTIGDASKGIICEVFVDFACPYSRKMIQTLSDHVTSDETYMSSMAFTYHNVIQPWHHQSLWLHESSFAVKILYPDSEWAYWKALFEDAPRWYDKEIYGLTRGEFYNRIAGFAANVVAANSNWDANAPSDPKVIKSRILQYLTPPLQKGGDFPSEATGLLGSGPDDDENAVFPMSRQVVKFARKRGVHVTPTVFFNGIEQGQISSGWSTEEWKGFLDQALA
eukprot:CAMPEP_0113564616 /NCGR_PEP_ID=MMETSP0015_2-20120614/21719_1 /TAXON_ID=2838 /ORGANISM="Odontella" /LENGTH=249 /DNA_ID=CAMNT_0000466719 /DNA_START=135 /DNA_END=884 /DNA_ORIENTATION=- /assembly_acc=CAM_ASM_000160